MTTHLLLLGRTAFDDEAVRDELENVDISLRTGTSLEDVAAAFDSGPVDIVIMGAGIPLSDRLEIVRHVFDSSESTTVHMKDRSSGRVGMMPFVNAVLRGLAADRSA